MPSVPSEVDAARRRERIGSRRSAAAGFALIAARLQGLLI